MHHCSILLSGDSAGDCHGLILSHAASSQQARFRDKMAFSINTPKLFLVLREEQEMRLLVMETYYWSSSQNLWGGLEEKRWLERERERDTERDWFLS